MAARNPARYLAPVALAATIAGGFLIVHNNLGARTHQAQTHRARHSSGPRGRYAKTKYYTVQPGQTMIGIANQTGVALNRLESLNPGVNPNALQAGQRLRLRR